MIRGAVCSASLPPTVGSLPPLERGLAHLSRLSGDFPTAVETAGRLGWEGRHHRVLGDVWWVQGDMERATAAYLAARSEAEEHGAIGETAMVQAHLAFAVSFADPLRADDELELVDRLLSRLSLRSSEMTVRIAALVRDAGFSADVPDRAAALLAEIGASGISYAAAKAAPGPVLPPRRSRRPGRPRRHDHPPARTHAERRLRLLRRDRVLRWPAFRSPSTPHKLGGSTENDRRANDGGTWFRPVASRLGTTC